LDDQCFSFLKTKVKRKRAGMVQWWSMGKFMTDVVVLLLKPQQDQ
jgi:predicted nucleic acid-binding Zn ribbon protein